MRKRDQPAAGSGMLARGFWDATEEPRPQRSAPTCRGPGTAAIHAEAIVGVPDGEAGRAAARGGSPSRDAVRRAARDEHAQVSSRHLAAEAILWGSRTQAVGVDQQFQATRSYSLMSPPSTGWRLIRGRSRFGTA